MKNAGEIKIEMYTMLEQPGNATMINNGRNLTGKTGTGKTCTEKTGGS